MEIPYEKKRRKIYKSKVKLTLAKVLDYIACMYEKKVKADSIDDKSGKKRDSLPEFCEDFFTQMFGIEALAGKKVIGAAAALYHTAVWTDRAEIFTFGDGEQGQMGFNDAGPCHDGSRAWVGPRLIEELNEGGKVATLRSWQAGDWGSDRTPVKA